MTWIWLGITLAIGLGVINLGLWYVDHKVVQRSIAKIKELLELVRRWEGWGRLICVITADAGITIPDMPPSIDDG